ncbi:TerC family protein [Brevibacillus invocatus]|uniref:TerC family protein n=1 Tax=Brevibacillus invocatus TaxID=173959 RepID=A0A3M8BRU6_9BACL|nr:TerC family protein [Brevibacillus invocatus]MCM3081515.1 TerC family protein [Brevibacillus invocatus]MCM3431916.1 TerC family protein [Brevibacillus invocatus]RNB66130.1 TerC family protein [Brevibacillus invocatus]
MTEFLLSVLQLIIVDLVLSGDNAVVIALACRNLNPQLQKKAIFWGTFGAVGMRVVLTFIAIWLLKIPLVQVVGGLLLLVIAIKLLKGEEEDSEVESSSSMMGALKTIIFADMIMSLDNVIAVAGAAKGSMLLVVIGLAISIPMIIWGSRLLMKLMKRFPVIVLLGAGMLGFTAGQMIMGDKLVGLYVEKYVPLSPTILPVALTLVVIALGSYMKRHGSKPDSNPTTNKNAENV